MDDLDNVNCNTDSEGDDGKAIKLLESHGYTMDKGFIWHKPKPDHAPLEDEAKALQYLMDEWDYGYED